MAIHIRRRELLVTLGGAAAVWPLAVRAQQGERVRRIGMLVALASDDPEAQARNAAFLQTLSELGWTVGRNVQIDYRWSGADADRIRKAASELVALAPDLIQANSTPALASLLQATRTVPIVFTQVADPVSAGVLATTIMPSVEPRANAVTARSTSTASRMPIGVNSTPSAGATAWIAANWAIPIVRSRSTATRVTPGATSLSSSSNLALAPNSTFVKPVMLPAGRAKLSTKPWPTGSPTCANTTGILSVTCRNAATLGVPDARMTSDPRATNSAAPLRWRSASSLPHR